MSYDQMQLMSSPFCIEQKVYVDGDESFKAHVHGLYFDKRGHLVEIRYWSNGEQKLCYVHPGRLTLVG